jgi:predicted RND superfamily exporter protein
MSPEMRKYYTQRHLDTVVKMRSETTLFDSLVNESFTKLRVTARLHQASSREILDSVARMEKYLAANFKGEYRAKLTGSTRLFAKMGRILVEGEIRGLGMAIISIFIVITILFRNVWMGLIAMVPNVVPIGITMAVMGFAKIPINVTTAMIPCIALGIAVDDTIHYVSRFKREFNDDGHYVNSMFRTLLSTGKPIIFTSAVLFCGFATLAFSDFSCNAYFGILTSITMASALLGDLIILPVLINVLRPLRRKPEGEE